MPKDKPDVSAAAQPLEVVSGNGSAPTLTLVLHTFNADGTAHDAPVEVSGTPEELETQRAAAEAAIGSGGYARLGES